MKKIFIVFILLLSVLLSAQQAEYVDFKRIKADISFLPDSSLVKGRYVVDFAVKKNIDTIFLDAKNLNKLSNSSVFYTVVDYDGKKLKGIDNRLDFDIKIDYDLNKVFLIYSFVKYQGYSVCFDFAIKPQKSLYFTKKGNDWNIWTQGQGKYTSNWLPSFDDVNEKVEFDLSITFENDYTVLANGKLDSVNSSKGYKTWHYNMQKPMPSYLVAFAIGKNDVKTETSNSGIPLEYYYYPEDSLKVEPTYRYTKKMFDFLEDEIGFAYPWQNYKQVPVHDFLYAGMENTSLTIFSDEFVVDSIGFNDRNYVNINAHELAHQWFGDLVTATSGEHHWLQEGFATYYALLAEKEVFGQDYFDFKLYNSAQDLGRQDVDGNGTSLLNPKSSSLTFYQRGGWVLYALRNKVGDDIFKKAVVNYLNKHQFLNVNTSDFISEAEALYGKSLSEFVSKWIEAEVFPFNDAVTLLKENSVFIQEYIMVDCETATSKCKEYLGGYISDEAKVKIIAQRADLVTKNTFRESRKVRQAISQYLTQIPANLQTEYETLLDDKSYLTIESALYNLWINFPSARSRYLSKTRKVHGFSNKNVRLLWLVLHLNTPEFQTDKKQEIINELKSYTNSENNFQLRIDAFNYLDLIGACDDDCKNNLEQATTHHNWRLVKFAKDMLKKYNK